MVAKHAIEVLFGDCKRLHVYELGLYKNTGTADVM
jgi:hypothetical protein